MTKHTGEIDWLLARALAGIDAPWPEIWTEAEHETALVKQADYHGIGGLLIAKAEALSGWPANVIAPLREQAVGQAMWEMRHRLVLSRVLFALDRDGIQAILLKGTALAYDLYENPATRTRGDTDLLVAQGDLKCTRQVLMELGLHLDPACAAASGELRLQEVWQFVFADGMSQFIDLHWQPMNSLALKETLTFADCSADPLRLPRLCEGAFALDRKLALIHACMHRAAHLTSPYIVDGVSHYGGDRLIWAYDIHLLAGAISALDWDSLCNVALDRGVGAVCLDGLRFAEQRLGTAIPGQVLARLAAAPADAKASMYLLGSGQARRALFDLWAVHGLRRKLRHIIARILPSRSFMRSKYPDMAGKPLVTLYARRLVELLRKRPDSTER